VSSALSADAKDALARELPEDALEREALLLGLARYGGTGGVFRTQRLATARLVVTLLAKSAWATAAPTRIERRERRRLGRGADFEVSLPGEVVAAVTAVSGAGRAASGPGRAASGPGRAASGAGRAASRAGRRARRAERRVELRAAFLAGGSIAVPARGYHLEFTFREAELAERVVRLIRAEGPEAKTIVRSGRRVVYLKDIDAIVAVLGALGAYGAVLRLEDRRAYKETKNRIRRLVNTEAANVDRAAQAAASQRERIAFLADAYGLPNLTPALREVAELRLAHPTETLAELGRLCDPLVKKSTVNGRIAALLRIARRLDEGSAGGRPVKSGPPRGEDDA